MRKALTMLGAVAALALGSFFTAPAAQAACTNVAPSATVQYPLPTNQAARNQQLVKINSWPKVAVKQSNPAISHLYYCVTGGNPSTDGQFTVTWEAAQTIGNKGSNVPPPYDLAELFYNDGLRIYFFEDINALDAEWGTNFHERIEDGEPSAVTLKAGDVHNANIPVNSIGIFRKRLNGTTYRDNTIKGNVYHELGHAVDRLLSYPSADPDSRWYKALALGGILRTDVDNLNFQSRADVFATVSATTIAPCQDLYNEPKTTYTNWEVAQCIWEYQTDWKNGAIAPLHQGNSQEFFANVFAVIVGQMFWDVNDSQVMYDLGAFIADNFGSGESKFYFQKTTAPTGIIYGGTP